ncbi:MAG: hypothetical protein ACR2GA_01960 [Chloroflexota bacterium]
MAIRVSTIPEVHLPNAAIRARCRPFAPYAYQILLLALIPLAFYLDVHTTSIAQQDVLGVMAWIILIACTRFSNPTERRQIWIMVGVATAVEIWSSIIWGVYRYRFGNLPLFVPPGHGLVYLFALRSARAPLVLKYKRGFVRAALIGATAWALFGVTLEPLFLHRLDVLGLMWWPLFIWFMRKPSAPIFAAAFFVTVILELVGTHMGNWTWQVYAPISHIPTGNPPSVISAGYCLMDFWALSIAAMLPPAGFVMRWLRRRRPVELAEILQGEVEACNTT